MGSILTAAPKGSPEKEAGECAGGRENVRVGNEESERVRIKLDRGSKRECVSWWTSWLVGESGKEDERVPTNGDDEILGVPELAKDKTSKNLCACWPGLA
jgi:hypothetical protein